MSAAGSTLGTGCLPTAAARKAGREYFRDKSQKQKSLSRAAGRVGEAPSRPSKTPIFSLPAGGPQSKQPSMTQSSMKQFLTGPGNWPLREIFAAREETWI